MKGNKYKLSKYDVTQPGITSFIIFENTCEKVRL